LNGEMTKSISALRWWVIGGVRHNFKERRTVNCCKRRTPGSSSGEDFSSVRGFLSDERSIAVDGRDFLYTLFQFGEPSRARAVLERSFEHSVLRYVVSGVGGFRSPRGWGNKEAQRNGFTAARNTEWRYRIMQKIGDHIRFSASDLVGHLDCHHLTALDAAVARGSLGKPKVWDPVLQTLLERGLTHERQYVETLRESGVSVVEIAGGGINSTQVDQTLGAMRSGADVIVQGALLQGVWSGRADILRRVEVASDLGAWSYEVIDTKLARETKGATVLQLSLYSDLLASAQGWVPEYMYVVTPGSGFEPQRYRTADFSAYYRLAKSGLGQFLDMDTSGGTYPEPNEHCDLCAWRVPCDQRRRGDDHLCLVAGITKIQMNELRAREVTTLATLAQVPLPLAWKPDRGVATSYERIREQARIQVQGRVEGKALYETLPVVKELGLSALPAPSPGDVFFDLEGDPFVDDGGLEYLFGYASEDDGIQYRGDWAVSREEERRAFESFVDFLTARWQQYPNFHVYHYAPYEPSALKRLMGRYATREEEIDRMLRGRLFVDLYQIVRHAVRASVESYSIKELERFFGFDRATKLQDASRALANVQKALEINDAEAISPELKATVAGYNRDDCMSARGLRNWLEQVRADLVAQGAVIDRPALTTDEASEDRSAWQARIEKLISRLTGDVPADVRERSAEQQARWILAHTLDWHRREEKAVWWEYFRLSGLSSDDLFDERAALSGLVFEGKVGGTTRAPVHRYRFPAQETEFRGDESLHRTGGDKLGAVERISLDGRVVDIKKRGDSADVHPDAVFEHDVIGTKEQAESLARLGDFVARCGLAGEGQYEAARDLLLRSPPRLGAEPLRLPNETALESAVRIAPKLRAGVFPVQGPPGTGKTHIGARMICALVKSGAKVGVTATSHKVIRRLLDEVLEAAGEGGQTVRCVQKVSEAEEDQPNLVFGKNNADVFRALHGSCDVAAGTAWLWSRVEALECVDVLFVDEAAQVSLANVLAVSHAAPSLVLLGDPRQLDQPAQGSHPEGTGVSALDYILNGRQTIGAEQGLFLGERWRLHPGICAFTSELFYESRLTAIPGLERQVIRSSGRIQGSGLRFLPVVHQGNQNSSPEEAGAIGKLVAEILASGTTWVDRHGTEKAVVLEDILIIAPYNAQVFDLKDRIPGARIGTVDKFQGQEAPIVIYSMTTSTHADAPRGMNFLYSLNRLNVATSRAKCLSILVCSPALFEPECRTPEQMKMANAFCRYLEMATGL
jgi:predicted RecB family nuclease